MAPECPSSVWFIVRLDPPPAGFPGNALPCAADVPLSLSAPGPPSAALEPFADAPAPAVSPFAPLSDDAALMPEPSSLSTFRSPSSPPAAIHPCFVDSWSSHAYSVQTSICICMYGQPSRKRRCTYVCESVFFNSDTHAHSVVKRLHEPSMSWSHTEVRTSRMGTVCALDASYLVPMPADALDCSIVGNRNLLAQVRKHLSLLSAPKPSNTSVSHTVSSLFLDTTKT